MRGDCNETETVLVYIPNEDIWHKLSHPLKHFTIATLSGRLLLVGGIDKCTYKTMNTIFTLGENSQRWLQSLPLMPIAVSCPAVIEYQDRLIVAGGVDSNGAKMTDVNILDTATNKWITVKPLPNTNFYNTCLIRDTLYFVGEDTKQVFRANVPSLISGASSGVWETIASVPLYLSSPVTVGNTIFTLGGSDTISSSGSDSTNIHLYDPTKDQWTKCGDLPKPMDCYCAELSDKMYVFGCASISSFVYMSTILIPHGSCI